VRDFLVKLQDANAHKSGLPLEVLVEVPEEVTRQDEISLVKAAIPLGSDTIFHLMKTLGSILINNKAN
jgi:hypothetical protein